VVSDSGPLDIFQSVGDQQESRKLCETFDGGVGVIDQSGLQPEIVHIGLAEQWRVRCGIDCREEDLEPFGFDSILGHCPHLELAPHFGVDFPVNLQELRAHLFPEFCECQRKCCIFCGVVVEEGAVSVE